MKLLILATTVVFATSVHAQERECTDFPQQCSELQMLEQIDAISDKECGIVNMNKDACKINYMSTDILMKRGYIKTPGGWIKKPKGYVPSKAE